MDLRDFTFNSAIGLAFFDQQVLKALQAVESRLGGNIVPDTSQQGGFGAMLPHTCVFNWEPYNNNFCYGQFLEFSNRQRNVKFWAGLDIQKKSNQNIEEVRFIIWFENNNLSQSCALLTNQSVTLYNNQLPLESSSNLKSCCVALDDNNFTAFCNNPINSPILSNFIEVVINAT